VGCQTKVSSRLPLAFSFVAHNSSTMTILATNKPSMLGKRVADFISIGFGSGATGVAPGTFGSLGAGLLWCALQVSVLPSSAVTHVVLLAVVVVVGTLAIGRSLRQLSDRDPGWIVIDEWAGMYAALLGANPSSWSQVLCAFIAFRVFDISKLGPVRQAERLPGSLGVMMDDLVAGALAWVVVQALTPLARSYGLMWGGPGLW
jgi:phosphatidylglycerophosphatase A